MYLAIFFSNVRPRCGRLSAIPVVPRGMQFFKLSGPPAICAESPPARSSHLVVRTTIECTHGRERFDGLRCSPGRRLTYDDLLLFPEGDGLRHEIIDGVHYVTPSPSLRHQDLVGRLYLAIGNFLATRPGLGRIFLRLDVVFTIHDVVEPDSVFVAGDQTDILTEANIQGPPAIVIEILSKSTRSRTNESRRSSSIAAATGYWIVDPDRNQLTVYRRERSALGACSTLSAADSAVLTTASIPGFSLSLSDLFRPTI